MILFSHRHYVRLTVVRIKTEPFTTHVKAMVSQNRVEPTTIMLGFRTMIVRTELVKGIHGQTTIISKTQVTNENGYEVRFTTRRLHEG